MKMIALLFTLLIAPLLWLNFMNGPTVPGVVHFTDDRKNIPAKFRDKVRSGRPFR